MPIITYATLGTKWQIVIPKEARDKLHIWPGDKVVLIIEGSRVMMINPDSMQHMINLIQEGINNDKQSDTKKPEKKKVSTKESPEILEKSDKKAKKHKKK